MFNLFQRVSEKTIFWSWLLLILVFLFPFKGLKAQELFARHYGVEDGLPSNQLYNMFHDTQGNMWFGSDRGAIKYDGYQFRTELDKNNPAFRYDFVNHFYENDSIIVINGLRNISVYLKEKDTLISIELRKISNYSMVDTTLKQKLILNNVDFNTKQQRFYLSTNMGLLVYTLASDSMWIATNEDFKFLNQPMFFKNNISLNDVSGLFLVDRGRRYELTDQITILANETSFYSYYFINPFDSTRFITYGNNLLQLTDEGPVVLKSFPHSISSVLVDHLQRVWIAQPFSGLYRYDNLNFENQQKILSIPGATCIVQDHENGYWITTLNNGIYFIPPTLITNIPIAENCAGFERSERGLYIATETGQLFRKEHGEDTVVLQFNFNAEYRTTFKDQKDSIYLVIKNTRDSQLPEGIVHMETGRFLMQGKTPRVVVTDSRNHFFLGVNGMYEVGNESNQTEEILSQPVDVRDAIYFEDKLWMAGRYGLWRWDLDKQKIKQMRSVDLTEEVNCIARYETFIIALSNKKGVAVCEPFGDSLRTVAYYDYKDGLSAEVFNSAFVQNDTTLWVCANKGLYRIRNWLSKKKAQVSRFSTKQGLLSNQVFKVDTIGGLLYVLTKKGFSILNQEYLQDFRNPIFHLDSVLVTGQKMSFRSLSELNYDQNLIKFHFHGISFADESKLMYHYRLIGKDEDTTWTSTQERFVIFSSLVSGNYTFQIKVSDPDRINYSEVQSVQFNIAIPWWKSWWFLLFVLTVIVIAFVIGFTYRIRSVLKKQTMLAELNEAKQQALSSQMNPHFIFNSLNSIQRYILQNDKKMSNKYLTKFSSLMRLILTNSTEKIITLEQELRALSLYLDLEMVRVKDKLDFEIKCDPGVSMTNKVPPLIFQPFVENAIWHGLMPKEEGGKITIEIKGFESHYECSIEDNGIGRDKARQLGAQQDKKHKSHGINITNKRIELANILFGRNLKTRIIDLKDKSDNALGTRVVIEIPYNLS